MSETAISLLKSWVMQRASDERPWLESSLEQLGQGAAERELHIFLGLAPRRLGKADLTLGPDEIAEADAALSGWQPADWSIDGAARVLALATFNVQRPFADVFKDLRRTSDAAELIALYRGLPLYREPDSLHFEVGEGLRSNLKPVFEAVAHNNPYPRDHFDEQRWNHMILKALFVGSQLGPVVGLRARANPELARILVDFAQERWAAGRPVPEDLWISVVPFRGSPALKPVLDQAVTDGKITEEVFQ